MSTLLPLLFDDNKVIYSVQRAALTSVLGNEKLTLLSSHGSMLKSNKTPNSVVRIIMKRFSRRSTRLPLPFDDNKVI